MNRLAKIVALGASLAAAALLHAAPADACGGCFHPPTVNTVVSGHRMALSVSMTRTVLWDQIQYQGNPEEFSWVLPIKPGARIEEAAPEWFEALEAVTVASVQAPELDCNNGAFSCGAPGGGVLAAAEASDVTDDSGGGVKVVKAETVGPYDSVTISSKDPAALTSWLESHGYVIPDDIAPIIDAYVGEGFDFIALRLTPGNGVNLMKPVRVITEGASPVLPLRMVSAGTGVNTSIVLYVIGEGRWETENAPNLEMPIEDLVWDGSVDDSNYAALREEMFARVANMGWLTTYAAKGAFFTQPERNEEGGARGRIADAYFGTMMGEDGSNYDAYQQCVSKYGGFNGAPSGLVIDTCDPDTGVCGGVQPGQLDARTFACGELTDLATALGGMHVQDVWVTRLEANLSRAGLAADLELRAASSQAMVNNFHVATESKNYECPAAPAIGSAKSGKGGSSGNGTPLVIVGLGAMAALLTMRRRFVRA